MLFDYFMATSWRQCRGDVATKLPDGNVAMTKWGLIGNVAAWSCVSWDSLCLKHMYLKMNAIKKATGPPHVFKNMLILGTKKVWNPCNRAI